MWFSSTGNDVLTISASNNGGSSWTTVEVITDTAGWELRTIEVTNLFASPNQFVLRYSTEDQPNNSVTEAGLDAFRIEDATCNQATWTTYGTGCNNGASAPSLQLVSLPALGSTFQVAVTGLGTGPAAISTGLTSISIPLPTLPFAPGCIALVQPVIADALPVTAGSATYSLAIPNNPAFAGLSLFQQALELGNLWTVSQGGEGTLN